jgi:hypothetical protein
MSTWVFIVKLLPHFWIINHNGRELLIEIVCVCLCVCVRVCVLRTREKICVVASVIKKRKNEQIGGLC